MATKSFLKTIDIGNSCLGESFFKALFECENIKNSDVEFKSNPKELKGEDAKDFFSNYTKQHDKV